MTQYASDAFIVKWADRFAQNTTGAIDELDLQEFADDISDSFVNKQALEGLDLVVKEATTDALGTVRYSTAQDPAGTPFVLSDSKVITGAVLNQVLSVLRSGKENVGVAAQLVAALRGNAPASRNTLEKLSQALDSIQNVDRSVAYYGDLAALEDKTGGENVFVQNAHADAPAAGAGDATVTTANTWAIYKYMATTDSWLKLLQGQALAVDFSVFVKSLTADLEAMYTPSVPADAQDAGIALVNGRSPFRQVLDRILAKLKIIRTDGPETEFLTKAGTYKPAPATDLSGYYPKTETYSQVQVGQMLDGKVDKVAGKQLSAEDFTTLLRERLLQQSGTNTGDNAANSRYEGKLDDVLAGANIAVDRTDPRKPRVAVTGVVKTVNYISPGTDGNVDVIAPASGGIAQYKGYFTTQAALLAAHPSGLDGEFVTVGETDTIWVWDSDTGAWVDSGTNSVNVDLTGYSRDESAENTADYTPAAPGFFDGMLLDALGKLKFKPALDWIVDRAGLLFPDGDGTSFWASDGSFKPVPSAYTDAQARAAISASLPVNYNSATGQIGLHINPNELELVGSNLQVKALPASKVTGLGNAASRNVGTAAGTVAAGDDSRFSEGRPPIGTASGDLSGSYPSPVIKSDASVDSNRPIVTNMLRDLCVSTAKIALKAVGFSQLRDFTSGTVMGRTSAGTGPAEEIPLVNLFVSPPAGTFNVDGFAPVAGTRGTFAHDGTYLYAWEADNQVYRYRKEGLYRREISLAAYAAVIADFGATLALTSTTIAQTVTLPLASSVIGANVINIGDESGQASSFAKTIVCQGADLIWLPGASSGAASVTLSNYQNFTLSSNGAGKYFVK